MIEHCISALRREQEDREYRVYVTDALKAIAYNTIQRFDFGSAFEAGYAMTYRWADGSDPKEEPEPEDDRPAAEVAASMWERIRGCEP